MAGIPDVLSCLLTGLEKVQLRATINCALNLLSLEGHNGFSSIQDRGYAIICKNIRRYLSKNVIGGEVSKNTAWKIG
jgi:hypothetical protein